MEERDMYCRGPEACSELLLSEARDVFRNRTCPTWGLTNRGNSCYINSLLQVLTKATPLAVACHLMHERGPGQRGHHCAMAEAQQQLCCFCCLATVEREAIPPDKVGKYLAARVQQISAHLRPGRQEDVHEFYRLFLDAVHCSMYEYHLAANPEKPRSPALEQSTLPNKLFGGWLRSSVRCKGCNEESVVYQPYLDLSLGVQRPDRGRAGQPQTLASALADLTHEETLTAAYDCAKCKQKKQDAAKRVALHTVPPVLVLQLQRFVHTARGTAKNLEFLRYPHRLDMAKYVVNENPVTPMDYTLQAWVLHKGQTANSGHYTCAVSHRGRWVYYDDDHVKALDTQQLANKVLTQSPYLLFYIRSDWLPPPADDALVPEPRRQPPSPGPQPHSPHSPVAKRPRVQQPTVVPHLKQAHIRRPLARPVANGRGKVNSALTGVAPRTPGLQRPVPSAAPPLEMRKTLPQRDPLPNGNAAKGTAHGASVSRQVQLLDEVPRTPQGSERSGAARTPDTASVQTPPRPPAKATALQFAKKGMEMSREKVMKYFLAITGFAPFRATTVAALPLRTVEEMIQRGVVEGLAAKGFPGIDVVVYTRLKGKECDPAATSLVDYHELGIHVHVGVKVPSLSAPKLVKMGFEVPLSAHGVPTTVMIVPMADDDAARRTLEEKFHVPPAASRKRPREPPAFAEITAAAREYIKRPQMRDAPAGLAALLAHLEEREKEWLASVEGREGGAARAFVAAWQEEGRAVDQLGKQLVLEVLAEEDAASILSPHAPLTPSSPAASPPPQMAGPQQSGLSAQSSATELQAPADAAVPPTLQSLSPLVSEDAEGLYRMGAVERFPTEESEATLVASPVGAAPLIPPPPLLHGGAAGTESLFSFEVNGSAPPGGAAALPEEEEGAAHNDRAPMTAEERRRRIVAAAQAALAGRDLAPVQKEQVWDRLGEVGVKPSWLEHENCAPALRESGQNFLRRVADTTLPCGEAVLAEELITLVLRHLGITPLPPEEDAGGFS
eukprot:TRINITY_DN11640_c0_g2_i1.p1 TRINITY_DN11640_c0_g2~~TRINITY_DN11640_c0_g2_i1.p1  ORF type:complete len:1010 (+),score=250.66 TRINITY_DN11640_c0_g2_i1:152-3181(+)